MASTEISKKAFSVGHAAKAIVAGLSAGSAVALTALSDGKLTVTEIAGIVAAVLASYGVTWTVPNEDAQK